MPSYTLMLDDTQDTALLYETERLTAQRATQVDDAGAPLPALTPAEVLMQRVASDLASVLTNLDSTVASVLPNIRLLSPAALAEVLSTIASAATRARVQQLLEGQP